MEDNRSSANLSDASQAASSIAKASVKAAAQDYLGATVEVAKGGKAILKIFAVIMTLCLLLVVFINSIPVMILSNIELFYGADAVDELAKDYTKNWESVAESFKDAIYSHIDPILTQELFTNCTSTNYPLGNGAVDNGAYAQMAMSLARSGGSGTVTTPDGQITYNAVVHDGGSSATMVLQEIMVDIQIKQMNDLALSQGADPSTLKNDKVLADQFEVTLYGDCIATPFDIIEILSAYALKISATEEEAVNLEWKSKDFEQFTEWMASENKADPKFFKKILRPSVGGGMVTFSWISTKDYVELMKLTPEKMEYFDAVYLSSAGILEGVFRYYHQDCQKNGREDFLRHELDEPYSYCANRYGYSSFFGISNRTIFTKDEKFKDSNRDDFNASDSGWDDSTTEGVFNPDSDFQLDYLPIDIARITSSYGYRTLFGKREFHKGIDFVGKSAHAPIYSTSNGTISSIVMGDKEIGNAIVIRHDNRKGADGVRPIPEYNSDVYYTVYQHLSRVNVSIGQTIKGGTTIGNQGGGGSTCGDKECRKGSGSTTGHHLHFAVALRDPIKSGYKNAQFQSPILKKSTNPV